MKRTKLTIVVLLSVASLSTLAYDSAYNGPAVTTTLGATHLTLADGNTIPFTDIFDNYLPIGPIGLDLPGGRSNFDIGLVANQDYQRLFRRYDANDNDHLERPEMVVLYVIEAAKGLGYRAESVGNTLPADALDVPRSDTRGLLAAIRAKRGSMSIETRQLFTDLPVIAREISDAERGGPLDI